MNRQQPEKLSPDPTSASDKPATADSMHDNVETWEDCCVCEPEPRWQALADELEAGTPGENQEGTAKPTKEG